MISKIKELYNNSSTQGRQLFSSIYYNSARVETIIKLFRKLPASKIEELLLELLEIDPMRDINALIRHLAFGESFALESVKRNAFAIAGYLAKTRRIPEIAYTHLVTHAYGTLLVPEDQVMMNTLEKIDIEILKKHIQTINKVDKSFASLNLGLERKEISELYFKMYELTGESLVIKEGKHFGKKVNQNKLEYLIAKKLITIKGGLKWFLDLINTGNKELFKNLLDHGYVSDIDKQKIIDKLGSKSNEYFQITNSPQQTISSKAMPSYSEFIQDKKRYEMLLDEVANHIQKSFHNQDLVDETFDQEYGLKSTAAEIYNYSEISTLKKSPQELRHYNSSLKNDLEFMKLCAVLAPDTCRYFLKKFKESPPVVAELIKFSVDLYCLSSSNILKQNDMDELHQLYFYSPKSKGANLFNLGTKKITPEIIKEAIMEDPLVYIALYHQDHSHHMSKLLTSSFLDELKRVYETSKQNVFHTLKRNKAHDFYNYTGRKKAINDFRKFIQKETKINDFGPALASIQDVDLLERLAVKSDLVNDDEILPLMYLQEDIVPSKDIATYLHSLLERKVTSLEKNYYPSTIDKNMYHRAISLRRRDDSYFCTLKYFLENFDQVINKQLLIPLHHINKFPKPEFNLSSLY